MDIKLYYNIETANGRPLKELASLLKKMEKSENPDEYLNELIPMIMGTEEAKLTAMIFPYITDMAINGGNLVLTQFLAEAKLRMMRFDLNILSDEVLDGYLTAIHNLQLSLACIVEDADWQDNFKTAYLYISLMIHSFSEDVIAFGENYFFDNAFHVKCPHCGNDLHSLYIAPDAGSQRSNVVPADMEGKKWDGLYFDDILTAFSCCFENSGEKYITKLLPYLYGTYKCTKCKKESIVMDAVKAYLFEKAAPWKPEKEYMMRIEDMIARAIKKADQRKAWFLAKYGVSLYKSLYGENNLDGHILALETGCQITTVFGFRFAQNIARKALEAAEEPGQPEDKAARIYHLAGVAYSNDYSKAANDLEAAFLYFEKAQKLYAKLYGEESEQAARAKIANARVAAEYGDETEDDNNMQPLLDELLSLQNKEGDNEDDIANLHHLIAEQYFDRGEYDKAIEHDLLHLSYICKEYGEDSDIAADYTREIGEFYQEAGDIDQALAYYEKAMDINIREMGKKYLLPPLLRNAVHSALKIFNAAAGDVELSDRALSASESFVDMGNLEMERGRYKKALKAYQKAWELRDWVTFVEFVESGDIMVKIGEAYEALNDLDHGLESYSRALFIYNRRIMANEYPGEVEECQESTSMLINKMKIFTEKLDSAQKEKIPAIYYAYLEED